MFTEEELKNLQILLGRVDLKGNEATATALLLQKIANLLTPGPGTLTPEQGTAKTSEPLPANT